MRWIRRLSLGVAVALSLSAVVVPKALGYNPSAAAVYADDWATACNFSDGNCYGDDCAAFVSKALYYAGYDMVGYGKDKTNDNYWWNRYQPYLGWDNSNSWSVAYRLYHFQILHYPGGYNWGTSPGYSGLVDSGLGKGDLLFYDWDGNGHIDHVSIIAAENQYDPNSRWYGDLVDQHSTDRYHAFWSLRPYNSQWSTTVITKVHIDTAN